MTTLDIILLIVFVVSVALGFRKGLIVQAGSAVAHFCKQLTHALALGGLDRLGGAVFSLFQWMLVLSILLNLWQMVKPSTNFLAMSTLGNGHAIEAVMGLAPGLLGWAVGC